MYVETINLALELPGWISLRYPDNMENLLFNKPVFDHELVRDDSDGDVEIQCLCCALVTRILVGQYFASLGP